MSALDLARQLLDGLEPHRPATRGSSELGLVYWFCKGDAPMAEGHAPECPWLRRGEIIAALERAEGDGAA